MDGSQHATVVQSLRLIIQRFCHMGGIRHNEIRDITATLLTEVCSNVSTEATLQPLSGERMSNPISLQTDDGARVDICARGFRNPSQDAFLNVGVFYPNASSKRSSDPTAAYRKHKQAKKRQHSTVSEKSSMECSPLRYLGGIGLRTPCRYDSTEASGNGMAKMQTIIR